MDTSSEPHFIDNEGRLVDKLMESEVMQIQYVDPDEIPPCYQDDYLPDKDLYPDISVYNYDPPQVK